MKLTRQRLRKMILKEVRLLHEADWKKPLGAALNAMSMKKLVEPVDILEPLLDVIKIGRKDKKVLDQLIKSLDRKVNKWTGMDLENTEDPDEL